MTTKGKNKRTHFTQTRTFHGGKAPVRRKGFKYDYGKQRPIKGTRRSERR